MSAVLVDVYKTQSFHCKKEQNVEIKLDIKYTSCGADAEILTIKAFYCLLIISCDLYAINRAGLLWQAINCWDKMG